MAKHLLAEQYKRLFESDVTKKIVEDFENRALEEEENTDEDCSYDEKEDIVEGIEGSNDPALQEVANIIQGKTLFQMRDELEAHGYVCSYTDLHLNSGYYLEAIKHGQEPIVIASTSTLEYEPENGVLVDGTYVVTFFN